MYLTSRDLEKLQRLAKDRFPGRDIKVTVLGGPDHHPMRGYDSTRYILWNRMEQRHEMPRFQSDAHRKLCEQGENEHNVDRFLYTMPHEYVFEDELSQYA